MENFEEKYNIKEHAEYLSKSDEISAVLKSHLSLEQVLDDALKKKLIKPDKILKLSFINKLHILHASGVLTDKQVSDWEDFNSLRNKFSHQHSYQLSKKDISFLDRLADGKNINIPNNLKDVPKILEITMITKAATLLKYELVYKYIQNEKVINEIMKKYITNKLKK